VSITINITNIFIPNGRVIRMGRGGEHPVADGLIRLSGMTQAVFVRTAERHGLPAAQARLLCMLATGPRRMSELAGLLGIEKAALTGLADRAERRGLVARTAGAG
jgi:DNA-binding MarR family transcriptional regulator